LYSSDCVAGGITTRSALSRSMPPACSSSSIESRLIESEPSTSIGVSNSDGSSDSVRHTCARACAHTRLPEIVLISPLCASMRNGCASGQRGLVFVEKRWWNTTTLLASSGRSG